MSSVGRLRRRLAVAHGMSDEVKIIRVLSRTGATHAGHVSRKVGLKWAGGERATGERVNMSRTFRADARELAHLDRQVS